MGYGAALKFEETRVGRRGLLRNESGAAFVEFALVIALLIVPVMFVINAGYVLFIEGQASDFVAREARRIAISIGKGNPATTSCTTLAANYSSQTQSHASATVGGSPTSTVRVDPASPPSSWGHVIVELSVNKPCIFPLMCGARDNWVVTANAPFERNASCT